MPNWLLIIIVVLLVLWVLGLIGHFLGGLINILLVVALILAIIWLVQRIRFRRQSRFYIRGFETPGLFLLRNMT
jgi:Flp pilus assembly protein TadB